MEKIVGEDMYRQQLIKEIRDNQEDMEKSLVENQASELIPLFKDYTDEIVRLIELKFGTKEKEKNNDVGCPVSDDCSPSGCYRYICCDFKRKE